MTGLPKSLFAGPPEETDRQPDHPGQPPSTVFAAAAKVGFGTVALGALRKGNVLFLGAVSNLRFSAAPTRPMPLHPFNGDYARGGSGANADDALTGAEGEHGDVDGLGRAVARVTTLRVALAPFDVLDNTAKTANINPQRPPGRSTTSRNTTTVTLFVEERWTSFI